MVFKFMPERITEARTVHGWSSHKLGMKTEKPGHQIKKYEEGVNVPSAVVVARLCNALNVEPGYFFSRENK